MSSTYQKLAAVIGSRVTLKILLPAASAILLLLATLGFLISSHVEGFIYSSANRLSSAEIDGSIRNLQSIYSVMSDRTTASMATLKILGKSQGEASLGPARDFSGSSVPDLKFGNSSQVGNYSIVDQVKSMTGSTATLFVLRDADFVRISTNVLTTDSSRAVGTVLDSSGKAYEAVRNGRSFLGVTEILGAPYFTSYEPIVDAAGKTIGVWYVGYPISSLKEIEEAIAKTKIMESGFIALFDAKGDLRFRSESASADAVKQVSQQTNANAEDGDWIVLKKPVESWGYTMIAAYPASDVNSQAATVRKYVGLLGAVFALVIVAALSILLNRLILKPLKQFESAANRAALGDADISVSMKRRDELGALSMSFDALIQDIKQKAAQLTAIAAGDLSVEVQKKSDADQLSIAMTEVVSSLRLLVTETAKLNQSAAEGRLSMRGNAGLFKGVYAEIVKGINRTLESVISPINEAANVLEKIAQKEMSSRITGDYSGDLAKIKNSVNQAADNLDVALNQVSQSVEQVASASSQINTGSQSLSQSASEQASSLEEISSNIQEMSSMTRQNTENAKEAYRLAEEAHSSTIKGVENMKRLSTAINQIKQSSDATAKIVKTIDEIAFQTNLLALNAAVEAARAGDAGKGFAVVAEEVRNLAMRSADAAKNTSSLIEESVQKAEGGVSTNAEVLSNLEEINEQISRVTTVVAEIAAASDQQNQGTEQINKAVEQMNRLTQHTAANAEESASAAQELASQAAEMKNLIQEFRLTASGTSTLKPAQAFRPERSRRAASSHKMQRPDAGLGNLRRSEDLIPFDENAKALTDF